MDDVIPVFSLKELLAQENGQLDKLREVLINRLNFYFKLRSQVYSLLSSLIHTVWYRQRLATFSWDKQRFQSRQVTLPPEFHWYHWSRMSTAYTYNSETPIIHCEIESECLSATHKINENSAYSLDTGIFHLSEYEDARSTTTEKFQSACRKFFDADLNEKNKIVSCGIPPRAVDYYGKASNVNLR